MESGLIVAIAESILFAQANSGDLKKTQKHLQKSLGSYLAKDEKISLSFLRKKRRSPDAPKRALTAFMFFSKANRELIKAKNPEATFKEMGKLLGDAWKALADSEKEKYVAESAADKLRYEEEKKKKASAAVSESA